jgi:putative membrane protein insertion efficiency factor
MKTVIMAVIRGYTFLISPFLGRNCRFHPTCSAYALQAIERHGVFKGSGLSIWRILRCNPWHKAPYDDLVSGDHHASCDDKTCEHNKAV